MLFVGVVSEILATVKAMVCGGGLRLFLAGCQKQYEYYRNLPFTIPKADHPALAGTPPVEGNKTIHISGPLQRRGIKQRCI
jgi:hypothetical protein